MATDVQLDDHVVTIVAESATILECPDLVLDGGKGRRKGAALHRRALVHDFNDGLTLNYAGDYPSGVRVASDLTIDGNVVHKGEIVGEVRITTLILQDFEPDPAAVEQEDGGPTTMRGIDLAEELHRLRGEIRRLSDRVQKLEAK